jgi:sigma-B regulation protein RsbU (phosphoserine phosphatase)
MILPAKEELERISGLDIAGYMQPADEVGGDYYDVLTLEDAIYVGIGDVTGHGLESGVLMLMAQASIRTLVEYGETDPVTIVNTLNRLIYRNIQRMGTKKMLTFVLLTHHHERLTLVGQHEDVLIIRHNGEVKRVDTVDLGFFIGLEEDISQWVEKATISLTPGDGVALYTDGITEAENNEGVQYGVDRLCAVLSRHWHQSSRAIIYAVMEDLRQFLGQASLEDDCTLVILKQPAHPLS